MKSPQEWARDCLQRIDLAGAEASASEVVSVIVAEAVAEAVREKESLTWQPGPPLAPGMYWYRTTFAPTPTIMLVTEDSFERLHASGLGGITLSSLRAGERAGPLPMPPE